MYVYVSYVLQIWLVRARVVVLTHRFFSSFGHLRGTKDLSSDNRPRDFLETSSEAYYFFLCRGLGVYRAAGTT